MMGDALIEDRCGLNVNDRGDKRVEVVGDLAELGGRIGETRGKTCGATELLYRERRWLLSGRDSGSCGRKDRGGKEGAAGSWWEKALA